MFITLSERVYQSKNEQIKKPAKRVCYEKCRKKAENLYDCGCDKMSVSELIAYLKFLEEPASDTVAILMTEQGRRILPTILSRCRVLTFTSLSPENVKQKLMEQGIPLQGASVISQITQNLEDGLALN